MREHAREGLCVRECVQARPGRLSSLGWMNSWVLFRVWTLLAGGGRLGLSSPSTGWLGMQSHRIAD
eukprot:1799740-Pleurochrysis_carterae.AAC.2